MNLGTMVTIAGQQPANLVHFVFEDGVYQTTGGQPVPGAGVFELAIMARGAGFRESFAYDDLEEFVGELPGIMAMDGPVFVCLKVFHAGEAPPSSGGFTAKAMRRLAKVLRDG
jgi:thiamine pyrophosphate-dependent acetolactate synthase large subunit-like protein